MPSFFFRELEQDHTVHNLDKYGDGVLKKTYRECARMIYETVSHSLSTACQLNYNREIGKSVNR